MFEFAIVVKMRRKYRQIIVSLVLIFTLIVGLLFFVNRYIYSWTGFIGCKVGLGQHKSVSVLGNNGYPIPLSYRFEPQMIAREMSKNQNYTVNNRYNGDGAVVSQNVNGVIYKVYFENRGFNLGTGISSNPGYGGEKCTVPDYILRDRVFAIIDDLPLSNEQKDEMKEHVHVVLEGSLKTF